MPTVYVVNRSGHDFSSLQALGDVIYLSEGLQDRWALNNFYRRFAAVLKNSDEDDWLVMTGLTSMNIIAFSIFAHLHGKINILIYNGEEEQYEQYRIKLDELV